MTGAGNAPREARTFHRLLTGRKAGPEIEDLYTRACRAHHLDQSDRLSSIAACSAVLAGLLDAGCGVIRPEHPLRQKLLIMTALAEAAPPSGRPLFLSRHRAATPLLFSLAGNCVLGAAKATAGIPLVWLLDR